MPIIIFFLLHPEENKYYFYALRSSLRGGVILKKGILMTKIQAIILVCQNISVHYFKGGFSPYIFGEDDVEKKNE